MSDAKKNVLMVMAHPDDEVIFGWPVLQRKDIGKAILCLSSDRLNSEREWCAHRADALDEICEHLGMKYLVLNYDSEFYRYITRDECLKNAMRIMQKAIGDILAKGDYDAIFAHNPIGEYGHIDHVLAHMLAMKFGGPIWITDIYMENNWMPLSAMPFAYSRIYYRNKIFDAENNLGEYAECEAIYRRHKCWTWDRPPIKTCSVYEI